MHTKAIAIYLLSALTACAGHVFAANKEGAASSPSIERGRYLVKIAQCNNCHTDQYSKTGGTIPERQWLTGNSRSWNEPIGTVYATNLRLFVKDISEDTWVVVTRNTRSRPPMPWWSLRDMSDSDLRSIYRYIRHLGPAGKPAPAFIPAKPDKKASGT